MRQHNYFYVVTSERPEVWVANLAHDHTYLRYIGGKFWPYTLAEARKARVRDGRRFIYKFGLPFHNFIKVVK